MRQRPRYDLGRRLDEIEETFAAAIDVCRCGQPDDGRPGGRSVVLVGPDEDPSLVCPECQRPRILIRLHLSERPPHGTSDSVSQGGQ